MSTSTARRLPPEIITDILIRLPPNSLLRFGCVSKSWRSEIDSPDFVKRHLHHSLKTQNNLNLILNGSHLYLVPLELSPTPKQLSATRLTPPLGPTRTGPSVHVVGSCNGLLAILKPKKDVAIWNPCTRKHRIPPAIEIGSNFSMGTNYGFGYDSLHDDYKLIRINQFFGYARVDVYSCKSNSWRRITDFPYYFFSPIGAYGVLVNEALHWMARRIPESDAKPLIVALDLRSEDYRELEYPDYGEGMKLEYPDYGEGMILGVDSLGAQLCAFTWGHPEERMDVWVIEEYGVKQSWKKLFTAESSVLGNFLFISTLVYSKDNGNEVLLALNDNVLVWFDMERNEINKVTVRDRSRSFRVWTMVGSLVGC